MNTILDIKITDGGTEPITLAQFKERWLIDGGDRDVELVFILKTARRKVEKYTGLLMTGATVVVLAELDDKFTLPYGRGTITTIKHLKGQDLAGANEWETLTATDYQILGSDKVIFIPQIDGTYEFTYTVTARTDDELVHDLGRVAMWLFENKGEQDIPMPLSLMSNAKTLKRLWV